MQHSPTRYMAVAQPPHHDIHKGSTRCYTSFGGTVVGSGNPTGTAGATTWAFQTATMFTTTHQVLHN